jgi:TatD DNase family protein
MLFDTHAHYDDRRFDDDRDELLQGMPSLGVGAIINPGVDLKSSEMALSIAQKYPFVYSGVGIHPHESKGYAPCMLSDLKVLAKEDKVVAIGEIGLDYHYDFSPRPVQKACFFDQMGLAESLGLPVIIHEREAAADCFDIVKQFSVAGVYHCYSGSLEMAKEIVNRGYYISFTGMITFPNVKKVLEVVKWIPLERILLETDCPYMTPVPFRGQRNHSGLVNLVARKIAELKDISYEEVVSVTYKNAEKLFLKKEG